MQKVTKSIRGTLTATFILFQRLTLYSVQGTAMAVWQAWILALCIGLAVRDGAAAPLPAEAPGAKREAERLNSLPPVSPVPTGHINNSGRKEKGGASYYAHRFANRKMADGRRMNPDSDVAASKTLPLGSLAKVTNLDNGKTATVKIEDRGPYVGGRVVDLAPKVADQLNLKEKGVADVEVKPITLPQPNGSVTLGSGAADASPRELQEAVAATKSLTAPKATETAEK
jgi:rare lipoprotein A